MEHVLGIVTYVSVGFVILGGLILGTKGALAARRGEGQERVSDSTVPAVFLILLGPSLLFMDEGAGLFGGWFTALAGWVGGFAAVLIFAVGIAAAFIAVWRYVVTPLGRLYARVLTS